MDEWDGELREAEEAEEAEWVGECGGVSGSVSVNGRDGAVGIGMDAISAAVSESSSSSTAVGCCDDWDSAGCCKGEGRDGGGEPADEALGASCRR